MPLHLRFPPLQIMVALVAMTIACAVFLPFWAAAARPPATAVQTLLDEERLAGMTWSLVLGERTIVGAAGRSNMTTGRRMRADNRIHVGSVTKTVLAVGILRLVSEGKLDLDAPVSQILPDMQLDNPWHPTHPVRVRHLLDHTAGLENLRIGQMFSAKVGPDDPLMSAFRRYPSVLGVRTRPGEIFSYANVGYGLAGLVIERVTGERYEQWLDRHLLAPLGMRDSTFAFVTQTGKADPRLAWGHGDNLSLHSAMPVALRPAGQFTTTAADMAVLARFLMGNGDVQGSPFIRPELLRAMGRPTGTAAARAGLKKGYALGLTVRERNGHSGLCHSGNIVGYRAMLCIYPDQQKAFFYSINTDGESADYRRFDTIMMKALELAPRKPAPAARPAPDIRDWNGHYVPMVSGISLERYGDMLVEGVGLKLDGEQPMLVPGDADPQPLAFAGGYLLRALDRSAPSHVLLRGPDGTRMLSDGLRTFRAISPLVVWAMWGSLAAGLAGLLYLVVASPVIARRSKRSLFQPGAVAPLLLIPAALLIYWQGFERFGDLTLGSAWLFAATVMLPLAMVVQAVHAFKRRYPRWALDLSASLAVLQWCVVLAAFGLLPLALWS